MTSGDESLTDELGDWLRREPGLRGRMRREQSPTPGTLGALPELVIGSCVSGAAGALATTLPQSH
ncbi:effector-associated constant component EACC1 [Streptomyces europaeiscabiei]|uniref:effector-associated constant component EACC1 n=1 Tax=Streptomyces europaeiscabiei TaxID=146819 RepID=UPI0038F763F6